MFSEAVEKHYGGDYYAFAEDYYTLERDVVDRTGADIIGHFDLITKFNEGDALLIRGIRDMLRHGSPRLRRSFRSVFRSS